MSRGNILPEWDRHAATLRCRNLQRSAWAGRMLLLPPWVLLRGERHRVREQSLPCRVSSAPLFCANILDTVKSSAVETSHNSADSQCGEISRTARVLLACFSPGPTAYGHSFYTRQSCSFCGRRILRPFPCPGVATFCMVLRCMVLLTCRVCRRSPRSRTRLAT